MDEIGRQILNNKILQPNIKIFSQWGILATPVYPVIRQLPSIRGRDMIFK